MTSTRLPPLSDREQQTYNLLQSALSAAVPLWIENLKLVPWSAIQDRLPAIGQQVAEHGDHILYRSKKKGKTAAAFNALAEGVAALSFCPGGITLFGLHFEAQHPDHAPASPPSPE